MTILATILAKILADEKVPKMFSFAKRGKPPEVGEQCLINININPKNLMGLDNNHLFFITIEEKEQEDDPDGFCSIDIKAIGHHADDSNLAFLLEMVFIPKTEKGTIVDARMLCIWPQQAS